MVQKVGLNATRKRKVCGKLEFLTKDDVGQDGIIVSCQNPKSVKRITMLRTFARNILRYNDSR